MPDKFTVGFESQDQETEVRSLPIKGTIPDWLSGTLIRNGPAKFEVGDRAYNHLFDGLAMLNVFAIENGVVSYTNRFLRSPNFQKCEETGRISYNQFATDPCRSIFKRLMTVFFPHDQFGHNAVVNVTKIADRFVAITETPLPVEFDRKTLKTLGVFNYDGFMNGYITTAHPQDDIKRKRTYNYLVGLSPILMPCYKLFYIDEGHRRRQLITRINQFEPAYMHSFGMTENYLILAEFPFIVRLTSLIASGLVADPFITNYRWKPDRGTRILVIDKNTGDRKATFETDAFFAFHHINAFEKNGDIVMDIAAYSNTSIIDEFYLGRLRGLNGGTLSKSTLRRYRLPLGKTNGTISEYEQITEKMIELPRINKLHYSTKDYRYAYGVSHSRPGKFVDELIRIDIEKGESKTWHEEGCFPGEPTFVAKPDARDETDGVNLAVVLDANKKSSFLLVLNSDFEEIARAEVPIAIPFGLHGEFYGN